MTDQSLSRQLIIGTDAVFLHILQNPLQNFLILRYAERTVCVGNDGVRSSGIEPGDRVAILIGAHRVLRLVPVMPWLVHADDRLHPLIDIFCIEAADANEIVTNLILLELQLLLIGKRL